MVDTYRPHIINPQQQYALVVGCDGFAAGLTPIMTDTKESGGYLPYPYFPNEPENIFPKRIIGLLVEGYCNDR